jgi:hypothetical protein
MMEQKRSRNACKVPVLQITAKQPVQKICIWNLLKVKILDIPINTFDHS